MAKLRAVAALLGDIGADPVRKGYGGADVSPMRKSGVVTVGYLPESQRYFDVHHAPTDTLDRVNPRELELGAAAIASLVYVIADLEEPLGSNQPPESE